MEEILYRLDERTERVDEHLDRLERNVRRNSKDIGKLKKTTDRNTRDISYGKGVLGFVVAAVTSIMAKLAGLVTF